MPNTEQETRVRDKPTVAIVDDDASVRDTTKDLLDSAGVSCATFDSAESFLQSKGTCAVRCLVADMRMPGMSGLDLYRHLASCGARIPTVLVTAYADEQACVQALETGVTCFLTKPFRPEDLLACIETALRESNPA
ncbi:response regulator transcription factor [Variovorax sp. RA8]|uniref:response regulator transcription factor n=1 Tax=Variovorax sp. (strain JCM 16519 / RA8) TaxID=662548 RepID=UPI000B2CB175|nr:response regulator [Variovorax sp. RA8]VTU15417.1 Transcriptional regulatory protein TdiR [Variovorax sp. RA8]